MPSKNVDNLKNRKKTEEPGKSTNQEPGEGKNMWETLEPKLASPSVQKAIYVTVAILFLAAVILVILYMMKLRAVTAKFRAATRIHVFIQKYNASYEGKRPIETFKGVEEVLGKLQQMYRRNMELQNSTDDIIRKIKAGWIPYGGHLYKYEASRRPFAEALDFCQRMNCELPEIHSLEDQNFMIEEFSKKNTPCWIAMRQDSRSSRWMWLNSKTEVRKFYWYPQKYDYSDHPGDLCVDMGQCAKKDMPDCWWDLPCHVPRNFFCRMQPDPRWL